MAFVRLRESKTAFSHVVTVLGDLYLHYEERGQVGNALQILHLVLLAGFEYDVICYIKIGLIPGDEFEEFLEESDRFPDYYEY